MFNLKDIFNPNKNKLIDIPDCKNPHPQYKIDILTIADGHGTLSKEEINSALLDHEPDVVFFLGDNFENDLSLALSVIDERFPGFNDYFGIIGNHDTWDALSKFPQIKYIHHNVVPFRGIAIGGLSGSIKYKNRPDLAMLTNSESEKACKNMALCDIFITHDKPCFTKPKDNNEEFTSNSHSGLTGIGEYIKEKEPLLVLHGHIHDRYIKKYNNTIIRSCYKAERFLAII